MEYLKLNSRIKFDGYFKDSLASIYKFIYDNRLNRNRQDDFEIKAKTGPKLDPKNGFDRYCFVTLYDMKGFEVVDRIALFYFNYFEGPLSVRIDESSFWVNEFFEDPYRKSQILNDHLRQGADRQK